MNKPTITSMRFRDGVLAAAKAIGLPMQLIELPNGYHRFIFLHGAWPIEWVVPACYCVWRDDDGPAWEDALREWMDVPR